MSNLVWTMSCLHVFSSVVVRPSSHHWNELNLTQSLLLHVSVCKVRLDPWILQHYVVKFIDHQLNSYMTTKSIVKRFVLLLFINWVLIFSTLLLWNLGLLLLIMERTFSFNLFLCLGCFLWRFSSGFRLFDDLALNRVEYFLEFTHLLLGDIEEIESLL